MNNLKVVDFKPQPDSKNVHRFKYLLSETKEILNTVDRAGMAIGEENLSLSILMELSSLITRLWDKDVRDSIPNVPFETYEKYLQRFKNSVTTADTAYDEGTQKMLIKEERSDHIMNII